MSILALDPAVSRRQLRHELRRARVHAGLTQRAVAEAMDWSLSKLIRIELGDVLISHTDLSALLQQYGVVDDEFERLIDIGRAARRPSSVPGVVTAQFREYLGLEASATVIRSFQPLCVPGLLQTEQYAREIIAKVPGVDPDAVADLIALRIDRQRLLTSEGAAQFEFVLDEAVVRRTVGSADDHAAQLRRLREVAELPNVEISVIPFGAGLHTLWRTPVVILQFPDFGVEDALYFESHFGEMVVREGDDTDRAAAVSEHRQFWSELVELSVPLTGPAGDAVLGV